MISNAKPLTKEGLYGVLLAIYFQGKDDPPLSDLFHAARERLEALRPYLGEQMFKECISRLHEAESNFGRDEQIARKVVRRVIQRIRYTPFVKSPHG